MKRNDMMQQAARLFSCLFLFTILLAPPVKVQAAGTELLAQAQDVTSPVLHSVSINKKTGAPGDHITVTLDVEDDLSGVDDYYLMVSYASPDRETEKYIYPKRGIDGLYRASLLVENEDQKGTWKILSIRLDDHAGNTRKIYNSALYPGADEKMDFSSGNIDVGYRVLFNSRGGSEIALQTALPGQLIRKPAAPIRSAYKFGGWYKDSGLVSPWDFTTDKASEDLMLYAKWMGIPSQVKARSQGYDTIGLTWWAPEGASQYKVYRATSYSGPYSYLATTSNTFYIDKGRTTGKTYYYKVRGIDPSAQISGFYSAVVKANPTLNVPSGFNALRSTSSSVRTSWNKTAGATGYEVWRSLSSGGTFYLRRSTSSLYYINTSLTSGRTYYYKVRAYRLVEGRKVYSSFSPTTSVRP